MKKKLRNSFISGLVIVAPFIVTVFVLKILFDWSLILINPIVSGTGLSSLTGNIELLAQIIAGIIVVLGISMIGAMSRTSKGRDLIGDVGRIPEMIPVFRTVYSTVRQVSRSITGGNSKFKRAVKLEYPKDGFQSIGFVTGEVPEEICGDEKHFYVYIPHSPNPTVGELKMVPGSEITEIDMSVRRALKTVMTSEISE